MNEYMDVDVKGQITLFHCEGEKFVISHVLIYIQLLKFDPVHDFRGISKVCISTNCIALDSHNERITLTSVLISLISILTSALELPVR